MKILQAEQPSYRPLQALAIPFSAAAISAENIPCLSWFSTVAMSAKIPYLKYALSYPGCLYTTKRRHTSIATQPAIQKTNRSQHKVSIAADAKADFRKELGHRQQAEC
jgi:hypothetical protein